MTNLQNHELHLIAHVSSHDNEFLARVVSGLPEGQTMSATGASPERARQLLLQMLRISGLKGTLRFERLMEVPVADVSSSLLTDKQLAYLKALSQKLCPWTEELEEAMRKLTRKQASQTIDNLKDSIAKLTAEGKMPHQLRAAQEAAKPKPASMPGTLPARTTVSEGMYRMDDVIYKVQRAVHGSGYLYAKKLIARSDGKFSFERAPGMLLKLRPEHKMTLDQAKEFGALYGTCCVCGRTLTNEDSIAAGIGPICAEKGGF